jgi:hypothetical protein
MLLVFANSAPFPIPSPSPTFPFAHFSSLQLPALFSDSGGLTVVNNDTRKTNFKCIATGLT